MTTIAKAYAAQSAKTPLAPWEFERRDLNPHDVQFDILYCGVCHSDLHQARGEWGNEVFPMVPGHEIVGRVVAVGSSVKKFKVGDLAGTGCLVDSCRECNSCQHGLEQFCENGPSFTYNGYEQDKKTLTQGGYSNTIVVHEDFTLRISDKLDLAATAPLLCAGITTYSPLRQWKVGKGQKVAVVGLGGLGHMGVKFAVAFGAEVTVMSTSPNKEEDAKKLGAHKFVVTKDAEQMKSVAGYFDFILDTVSAPHDLNAYLGLLKPKGVMVCVGIPPTPYQLHAFSLVAGSKVLAGSMIGGLAETQEMLDFCADHNVVSEIEMIDIKDIENAFERMAKGDVRYRFVIDMGTL
ncbi:NAD(P)-dependent alcohol dehydrogenase [Flavobacterium selenitireducens]|uniref:NAD(P)-dependent alcohol dehydrogenase n=1 Tax=Flavobacterium selenitireducens TaxID=2722704 RepID=UPI00168ADF89|nr:NAD(P)-dependent alcohol dehydrogenase [Flavobacterium selenitireducens]MBD3581324.1 NAD(P)-dependent alcohol dehydrogenase [Flavobacterium selenitireducens]